MVACLNVESSLVDRLRSRTEAGYLTALAVMPLAVNPFVRDDTLRGVILIALGWLLLALMVARIALGDHRPSLLLVSTLTGLLVTVALATITALNPLMSFLGGPRQQGFLQLAACVVICEAIATTVTTRQHLMHIAKVVSIVATVIAAYAIVQKLDLDVLDWNSQQRPFATLGNPDALASFLVMTIPVTVVLVLVDSKWNIPLALLQIAALLSTGARAGVVALVVGSLCVLVVTLKAKYRFIAANCIAISAALLIYRFHDLILNGNGKSALIRLQVWRGMIDAVKQRPLIGHGLESTTAAFASVHSAFVDGDRFVDNAHNFVLETLSTTGVLGLSVWITFLVITGIVLYKLTQSAHLTLVIPALCCVCIFVGHIVDAELTMETLTAQLYLFVAIGVIFALKEQSWHSLPS